MKTLAWHKGEELTRMDLTYRRVALGIVAALVIVALVVDALAFGAASQALDPSLPQPAPLQIELLQ